MPFELSFQPVREDEIEFLSAMASETFTNTFRHYDKADLDQYLQESLSPQALSLELAVTENQFYFVVVNGERAGYLKWIFPTRKYLEHVEVSWKAPLLLERFYFLPSQCGKGLGPVALAFVESYARYQAKADVLYLSVWDRNYRAQSFYQKYGFRTLGSFDYPVGDEIDHELLYFKRL